MSTKCKLPKFSLKAPWVALVRFRSTSNKLRFGSVRQKIPGEYSWPTFSHYENAPHQYLTRKLIGILLLTTRTFRQWQNHLRNMDQQKCSPTETDFVSSNFSNAWNHDEKERFDVASLKKHRMLTSSNQKTSPARGQECVAYRSIATVQTFNHTNGMLWLSFTIY